MVCSQEDLIYGFRPLTVVCNGLMPKSMVSLAVVSRVPSMVFSSLFDSVLLLEMFRVLHFGNAKVHFQGVTPVGELSCLAEERSYQKSSK